MDKYEVAVLAEDYERKRMAFEAHHMRNVYGLKPEERIEAGIAYHVVEAEMIEALGKLQRAKNAVQ
jgi:hypothetical protein